MMVWALLTALLGGLLVLHGAYGTPTLLLTSPANQIRVGSTVQFSCIARGYASSFYTNGGQICIVRRSTGDSEYTRLGSWAPSVNNVANSRYQIRGTKLSDRTVIDFTLRKAEINDDSDYQCAMYDSENDWLRGSDTLRLDIMQPPSLIYPTCSVSILEDKSSDFKFICRSKRTNPPSLLIWERNAVEIDRETTYRHYTMHENTLNVNKSEMSNVYACKLYYSDGENSLTRSCQLTKPSLVITPVQPLAKIGEDLSITVFAIAGPELKKPIECFEQIGLCPNCSKGKDIVFASSANNYGKIIYQNINMESNGKYVKCTAENFFGNYTITFAIEVIEPPQGNLQASLVSNSNKVLEGSSSYFVCSVISSPYVTDLKIAWFLNDNLLDGDALTRRFKVDKNNHILQIMNITKEDEGTTVHCVVSNQDDNKESNKGVISVRTDPVCAQNIVGGESSVTLATSTDVRCEGSVTLTAFAEQNMAIFIIVLILCIAGIIFSIYVTYKMVMCIKYKRKRSSKVAGTFVDRGGNFVDNGWHYCSPDVGMNRRSVTNQSVANRSLPCIPEVMSPMVQRKIYKTTDDNKHASIYHIPNFPNKETSQPYMDMNGIQPSSPPPPYTTNNGQTLNVPNVFFEKEEDHPNLNTAQRKQVDCNESNSTKLSKKTVEDNYQDLEELKDLYRSKAEINPYLKSL